ncbi:MAG: HD domain-containing protein, partial [Streptomycetaceae bacterium]|nr:HD domain-containing protein [Streptomycetaceae bacterium]
MTIGGIDPPVGAGAREVTPRPVDARPDKRGDTSTSKPDHSPERSSRASRRPVQRLSLAAATFLIGGNRRRSPEALETLIPLVQVHRAHHPKADLALLQRAFVVAELSHRGQMRKSGEAYITHPLAVATILAELGADTTTLVAALLHDTDLTLDTVRESFGDDVAHLVDGVTKLEKVDFNNRQEAEAETMRKILVATGRDLRVTVIKLADRLHNMRTIRHMRRASQIRIAEVTRDVFIPLAERLGIHVLKTELEDIVFSTLQPDEHAGIVRVLADQAAERDEAAATL